MTDAAVAESVEATRAEPEPWEALEPGEYAIIELFGHQTLVGRVEEVERFGAKMMALQVLFRGQLLPAVFHGGAAIYRLTPCAAEVAWKRQRTEKYQLPGAIAAVVPPLLLEAPQVSNVEEEDFTS